MKALSTNSILFKILPVFLLVDLVGIFFYKVLFLGHNFFWRDILSHSYPAKKIFVDAIREGYYPLWNQFISAGIPYLADLSNQPLYIFNLLFIILPANVAINTTVQLHYILGAVFMYLLVCELLKNKYICILSALSFVLSGYCLSLSCNLEYLTPVVWLPAAFWAFYKTLNTYKSLYALLCAIFLAMMFFGGEPMAFYYTVGFFFIRTLFELKEKKLFVRSFVLMLVIVLTSLIISAIQLLPAVELTHLSIRATGLSFAEATTWSFNPYRLIEFVIPFFFGNNFPYPQYWGVSLQSGNFNVPWAEAVYIGVIPLVLAFVAIFINRFKEKYFWLSVVIISLILSFGCFTPIYQLFFKFLPFISSFRYPEKLVLFTAFALSILAGYGLKDLIEHKFYTQGKKVLLIPFALVIFAIITVFLPLNLCINEKSLVISGFLDVTQIVNNIKFGMIYFFIIIAMFVSLWYWNKVKNKNATAFIFIVVIITFLDLFFVNSNSYVTSKQNLLSKFNNSQDSIYAGWDKKYPPRVYFSPTLSDVTSLNIIKVKDPKILKQFHTLVAKFWQNNLIPNRAILVDINTFNTVTSLTLKNISPISRVLIKQNPVAFVKLFNIDYLMCSKKDASKFISIADRYIESANNVILQPENTLPRAIFTTIEMDKVNIFNELVNYQSSSSDPEIIRYESNKVIVEVNAKEQGYLTLFDSYYPGWKVMVDNKPVTILQISGLYRGVALKKGQHVVEFLFDPIIVKIGMLISFIGLLIAGILTYKFKIIMKA